MELKILHINSHYNQGGAAKVVTCIHEQLKLEGIESYVAYGRGKVINDPKVIRFNTVPEIYSSALFTRVTGISGWFNIAATKRLMNQMKKWNPDLIHLHAVHGYYLNLPLLFQYINDNDIPCVWTFHDCYAFVGKCGYYFECTLWKSGCGHCPHVHNYPKRQWFDFTRWMWKKKRKLFTEGNKKVIVTPSEWLTNEAKASFFRKYPCLTIRNGIDTDTVFYPRNKKEVRKKYGYQESEKIVLGIAVEIGRAHV